MIQELFDSPLPFSNFYNITNNYVLSWFYLDDYIFAVTMTKDPGANPWEVVFERIHKSDVATGELTDFDEYTFKLVHSALGIGTTKLTHAGNSVPVMSTVNAILRAFNKKYSPNLITFTAKVKERGRVNLYRRLAEKSAEELGYTVKEREIHDGNSIQWFLKKKAKIRSFKEHSESLKFHLENKIPLSENVFRYGSKGHFDLIEEYRMNQDSLILSETDKEILSTDIGKFGIYEGKEVPLDLPFIQESEDVELNKPKRGGSKKFYVYVKNKKGNVIKVQFGDTTGLKAKINNPEARKSFVARHKCSTKKDKTKPGYWACRLPYYAKSLGLSGGGNFYW